MSDEHNAHILIAEDSPTQLIKVKHILTTKGYQVTAVRNGQEALQKLQEITPALIISDVMMPEMNGYELCRAIKDDAQLQDIPVILLTALGEAQDIMQGLAAGANGYVIKPYTEQLLLSRVSYVLANLELRRQSGAEMGLQVYFANQKHFLTADRVQILDLLLSTYEATLQKNAELEEANNKLQQAISTIKTLRGLVPICMHCKKIRDDKGFWEKLETYIANHSDVQFSHGICPDCLEQARDDMKQ